MKNTNPNLDENGDFIFRWKIDQSTKKKGSKDPFLEFTNDLIKELLNIVTLTYKGEDLKIDGFHFLNSIKNHKLYK